ncbi:hypothetical protein FLL65_08540 [Vibrio cholerae]|nr:MULTISPECIES: hypothetical protein [Vibrio]EEY46603.1 hypothetical protein VMA_000074 [Vibrio mimicus VM223]ELJ8717847.1 hypothetical protein [Vibrio cholerae]TQO98973.1 hypothetical protein FLL97_15610 [Vibrio cholerae]TQP86838.1 hypothetical protein FLL74_13600 [Vibrio cholerae]TQQ48902.1 hypothetical protein FLL65_08540 [Vibrio cholerae]
MEQQSQQWFKRNRKKIVGAVVAIATIVLLPFVKDVLTFEYQTYRQDLVTSKVVHAESDTASIAESDLIESQQALSNSIEQLSKTWEQSYLKLHQEYLDTLEEQYRARETFAYLEGSEPESNYRIFLESYYGLNGRTKLEKLSVNDLVGKNVSWALKLEQIHLDEETNATYAMFVPVEPLCDENECPESYDDILFVRLCECDATTAFLQETRVGDFVYLEGKGYLWDYDGTDIEYRHRFTLDISAYRYRKHE